MKKFRLLSFLCLLVIGWGNAWGATYPKTWDFTTSSSTEGLTITNTGQASNWVYVEGIGWTGQRGGNEAIITIPNVMYGNVITIYLSTGGTNPDNNNGKKSWSLSCGGINVSGNGRDVGTKAITIPATVTSLTDATISIRGFSAQSWLVLSRIEVTRSPITFNVDNGIYIDNPAEQYPNRVDYKTQLQNGDVTIPVYNENNAFWTIDPRFKINGEDNFNIDALCDGTFDPSYFEVTYSTAGILSNEAIRADRSATVDGNTFNTRFRFRLSDVSRGTTSMTVTYKGSQGFEPFSKTINFNVEGINCQISDANMGNSYTAFIDDPQQKPSFRLRLLDLTAQNFDQSVDCTAKIVDDSGEEISSNIVVLGSPYYNNKGYLVVPITPNTLGTVTIRLDYPGDAVHEPATFMFDYTIRQHMVELRWVTNGNETDEWRTNQNNGYYGIPQLKMYIDNKEVSVANNINKLQFTSSNIGVATINSGNISSVGNDGDGNNRQYVNWAGAGGMTVIEARFLNQSKQVDGLTYYYYNDEAATYTMILDVPGASQGPRIVWISGGRDYATRYGSTGKSARGSYMGQKFIDNLPYGATTGPINISAGYGNDVIVSAVALKPWVTDAMLAEKGIKPIPNSGHNDHFYIIDLDGGWRASKTECIPANWRWDYVEGDNNTPHYDGDPYFKYINYMVNRPAEVRTTELHEGTNNNNQSWYKIVPAIPNHEPLKIYASVDGYSEYSYTEVLVNPGELQLHFVPDENTVNEGKSISPYVNCPDLRLEDVNKIWLDYQCNEILNVANNGVVYEAGVTTQTNIAKYLFTVTANDTIYKNVDHPEYGIQEIRPTTWLRGINPEIFGVANAAPNSCTVTLHLTSEMYNEATAPYTLHVVGDANTKTMFHFEINDNNGSDTQITSADKCKTITMVEGDYIHMPGIIGNSNGNWDYSPANSYKYMYSISNGNVIMSYAKYFPGEGVPNYYLTNTFGGNPATPKSNASTNQVAIITWSHGLGNYWRNDSLMIFGNKPGEMFIYAQDPQTKLTCSPIKVKVLPKQTLDAVKQAELADMTYPFTWDFEHMDMTEYVADATENGGTYWRERWDEPKNDKRVGAQLYNRHYNVKRDYYQYNGGMNADWDDKDNNGTSRQRWFKDIYANGKYVPEFKGIMLNLSGLDYWEQKYQRFNIDKEGKYIYFEGGPIFVQLPGFGLLNKKTGVENAGTRAYDNYIGGEHNHINTAGYNVNEGYTQMLSVDNTKNKDVTYPVQEKYRNNKVRFVIKAQAGRELKEEHQDIMIPNENPYSQFHIGGASMINENLNVNDIRWSYDIDDPTVHNGYSVLNLDDKKAKVYIVELDPYDPELQDHIYLMFNNDVKVYWMAITNEPRNILSDFDGVTYSYPKDIDMEKTNQTLAQQTTEGIYTKASDAHDGTYALASQGQYTKKNVYQVGNTAPGKGIEVQLDAYTVSSFSSTDQAVTLSKINGNIPKNEGVMLYTTPRMSELAKNPIGLEPATYYRGTTAYSVPYEYTYQNEKGETVTTTKYHWYTATEGYNNVHNYYYLPLYFIAQAENMSKDNYVAPESTYGGLDISQGPTIADGHVITPNLLRPTTYGQVLSTDNRPDDQAADVIGENDVIHFGYNNEFICRNLVYVEGNVTKKMDPPYVDRPDGAHEDVYYYEIGIDFARFYRINSPNLNHHNRSAYMTLTWDEYKVHTVGKPLAITGTQTQSNQAPKNIRFSSTSNPIDIRFEGTNNGEDLVSEDGGFLDGINEVEQVSTDNGKVYNLNGVPVNTLSKGVYIINGKKIVVK